jgi:hypothetical protein
MEREEEFSGNGGDHEPAYAGAHHRPRLLFSFSRKKERKKARTSSVSRKKSQLHSLRERERERESMPTTNSIARHLAESDAGATDSSSKNNSVVGLCLARRPSPRPDQSHHQARKGREGEEKKAYD